MIEFIIGGIILAGGTLVNLTAAGENHRFPRSTYSALVGWWYGAFQPDNAACGIANMLDSDLDCELWKKESISLSRSSVYSTPSLKSEALGTSVHYPDSGRVQLIFKGKDGENISFPISSYDDHILYKSIKRWLKRAEEVSKRKIVSKSETLLHERVTKRYINNIEMIEKKILGREDSTVADQLRALLPPPEHPKESNISETVKSKKIKFAKEF